jgi:membrane-associated HD superfamily phosphohydrolase
MKNKKYLIFFVSLFIVNPVIQSMSLYQKKKPDLSKNEMSLLQQLQTATEQFKKNKNYGKSIIADLNQLMELTKKRYNTLQENIKKAENPDLTKQIEGKPTKEVAALWELSKKIKKILAPFHEERQKLLLKIFNAPPANDSSTKQNQWEIYKQVLKIEFDVLQKEASFLKIFEDGTNDYLFWFFKKQGV